MKREICLGPKLLAVSVAACFALNAGTPRANPSGPSVVHGSVGFSGLGTSALTITNQAGGNAIINWNGFSIGVNEITRFQQFANLAVLNRVTGGDVSSILGALQSDGRVFLINPNGIVFGASARIDTAGLVASSLALSSQDFLAGRLRFTEVPGAGAVVNNGVIETAAGGRVYLVAPSVENNGIIRSPQGAIVLAAGKEVELVDPASPFVTVKVASAEQAVNVGSLVADGGQIGMFGALVRNSGVVEAGGAEVGPGGEIRLVAAKDLDVGGTVSANGTSGGKVLLQAEGGTNLVGGTVEAKGSSGTGGEVSALGVRVGVMGHGVIDASGEAGGGTVLVGGDYQGNNAAVQNAERTYIGADGVIRADAMTTGDGGRVVVWADGDTRFYGSISARGGSEGGNGGFVETSGKEVLQVSGIVSTAAPNGQSGTWLLDPGNLVIEANNSGPDDNQVVQTGTIAFADPFGGGSGSATVGVGSINAGLLVNGTVVLQAVADIVLETDVNLTNIGNLTLQAGNDIDLGSFGISLLGDLVMNANHPSAGRDADPTAGSILSSAGGGNITTNGGHLSASGVGVSLGSINAAGGAPGGGNVSITATGANLVTGSITSNTASVGLSALSGVITVNGDIDTSGADGFNVGQGQNGSVYGGGSGGDVTLSGAAATVSGSILTVGGDGLDSPASNASNSRAGGGGGNVTVNVSGEFSVTGTIDASGGNGGAAGNPIAVTSGGSGGTVSISVGGTADVGAIASRGGNAGAGSGAANVGGGGGIIDIGAGNAIAVRAVDASGGNGGQGAGVGGDGGSGGSVTFSGLAGVTVAAIDVAGGHGGSGGSSGTDASGGNGGDGGAASIYAGLIATGEILARGGDGGAGGTLSDAAGSADGGAGGAGGAVTLDTTGQRARSALLTEQLVLSDQLLLEVSPPTSFTGGPIVTGPINLSGGNGGNSGAVGSASSAGGAGGAGGDLLLIGGAIDTSGPILAAGGDGGASVNASLGGTGTPSGGDGGDGGNVEIYGAGLVRLNIGGTLGALALDVSGGAGGAGNPATSPAGDGGDGGNGGTAYVIGTPDIQIFGSMDASGGAGGAGGAGNALFADGLDGGGGTGGSIYLDASSVTGSQAGDGFIYVLSSTQFDVSGGAAGGGFSGSDSGSSGSSGTSGTFEQNSDYFGTIVGLDTLPVDPLPVDPLPGDPLLSEQINSGFQQIVGGTQDTVAFVGGEKAEEEEDESQKELASCKG